MKTILTSLLCCVGSILIAQVTFYKSFETGNLDNQCFDIVALDDGGYAYTGISEDAAGNYHVNVTKLTCDGSVDWAYEFGNSSTINNVFSSVIQADNGDIVVVNNVGSYQDYNMLVLRITQEGTVVWKKRIGGNRDDIVRGIVQTSDGHFVLTGSTNSAGTDTGGTLSYTDIYICKLDETDGSMIWSKTYGQQGQIDGGYAIAEDASGNLIMTGRYIVLGTFFTYILKTDSEGEVIFFKGYGAENHRTYGYAVTVATDGSYVIVGSTTMDKIDFTSYPDPYVIKTDSDGNILFANIYYPVVGNDNSESASSIVETLNGGFAIGVPTFSFTTLSQGFVPNKNAMISISSNGAIEKAMIYNQGGSHYTRLNGDLDGGYILSNFSNFFSTDFEFLPLIVKTDENFESGCLEMNVTTFIDVATYNWNQQDISYTQSSGLSATDMSNETSYTYAETNTQCESFPEITANFNATDGCQGDVLSFEDMSSDNVISWDWDFGGAGNSDEQNPDFTFNDGGNYLVSLTVSDGCQEAVFEQTVTIDPALLGTAEMTICNGDSILIGDTYQTTAGTYEVYIAQDDCDSLIITELIVNEPDVEMRDSVLCAGEEAFLGGAVQTEAGIYTDTIPQGLCNLIVITNVVISEDCGCKIEFPNAFTPDNDGNNDSFRMLYQCGARIDVFELYVYDRWGELVFETTNPDISWEGICGGSNCPSDVYVWMAKYEFELDGQKQMVTDQGDITLIR